LQRNKLITGRIINYNADTKSGLVESEQSESYSFSGEVWGGSNLPYSGQLVEFETFWTFADSVFPAQDTRVPGIFEASIKILKAAQDILQSMGSERSSAPRSGKIHTEKTGSDKVHSDKNKIVAFFLALFLGMYGAHKFYLGYVIPGLIHLAALVLAILLITVNDAFMTIGSILTALMYLVPSIEAWIYLFTSKKRFRVKYIESRHPWF